MLIENKNTHKNHRMRLYDTISQVGLDKTNDFLALEFILTYVIPRKDTNPVAHRLIDKYGSIPNVLEANINKSGENTTRFAVLSKVKANNPSFSNSVLMFTVKNEAGSLASAISIIGKYGYNMTALRSRPLKKHSWQYYFYIEIDGTTETEKGKLMLDELKGVCDKLKVAGTFAPHSEI